MQVRSLVIAAIVVGIGTAGGASAQAAATVQGNKLAALREAQHLVSLGRAPAGATPMSSATACTTVDGDLGTPAGTSLVEAQRAWRAHGSLATIASWLYTHRPAGLQLTTWMGAAADGGGPWGYSDRPSAQWQSAQLGVGAAYLSPSTTAVCLEAQVLWLDPRPWPDNAAGPRVHVAVSAGCPTSDAKLVGVSNAGADLKTRLLPTGEPTAALVCSYNGYNGPASKLPQLSAAMKLAHQARLGTLAAGRLASAVNALALSHVDGAMTACPAAMGTASILAFSYLGDPDVDIWVVPTGCPFFANGYVRTGWLTVDVAKFLQQYS